MERKTLTYKSTWRADLPIPAPFFFCHVTTNKEILNVMRTLGHKNIKNTIIYTQLVDFKDEEYHVAHAKDLEEENKLIGAGFQYVRYSEKDAVAIYRKPK